MHRYRWAPFHWHIEVEERNKNSCVVLIFSVEAEDINSEEEKRLELIEQRTCSNIVQRPSA